VRLRSCLILLATAAWPAATSLSAQQRPELFGPGIFSTGAWDFFVAFTPDQRTAYFCRANGDFTYYTILESRLMDGRWSEPEAAPFSGRWSDADPHVSPDGSRLFFISNRPVSGATPSEEYDIWTVERSAAGGWGQPRRLDGAVNRDSATEWSPSLASNGNLYFGTVRPEGKGGHDLYVARWADGRYAEPENLGDSLNTGAQEYEPWISPDERFMIFSAVGRPDGAGGFDLFVSERRNGVWQRARPLTGINTPKGEFNQSVSPDGKYLYFSSTRGTLDSMPPAPLSYQEMQRRLTGIGNGLGDIYRIPLSDLGIPPRK